MLTEAPDHKPAPKKRQLRQKSSHNIGVAAEAIAAAQFARCGFDVSVQYGASQPEYDLIVARGDDLLKVSVKGSQDGAWGLTQAFIKATTADYHGAIERWLARHGQKTDFCFVQFANVRLDELPRVYLATPAEVAQRLREARKGRGDSILYERHEWTGRAHGAGTIEEIPASWRFSEARVQELLAGAWELIGISL